MNFESCGAGMQTTALTLMSCENALRGRPVYPLVPVYDGVFFADLGCEPAWVYDQVEFLSRACGQCGIPFYVIRTDLYGHYMRNFGKARVVSIPFWSVDEDGKKGKMMRNCTLDFKIKVIQKFIKFNLLGYRMDGDKRTRDEDRKAHTMHIGFSAEEAQRIFDNPHPMFINQFPLKEMGWMRADSYRYCLERWGLKTKASACTVCPFHRNFFFRYLQRHYPADYAAAVAFDELLEQEQANTKIRSKLYISRSRKRLAELTDEDCNDAEYFDYRGKAVWNGF